MSKNREMPPLPKSSEVDSGDAAEFAQEVVTPKPKASAIEVVATRPGFYKQMRKVEGDKFTYVGDFESMGSWMKCVDPVLQKKHMEVQKKRKAVLRARASGGYDNELAEAKKPAGV